MVRRDSIDLGVWSRVCARAAHRAARYPCHPGGGAVPGADRAPEPRLERWRPEITASLRTLRSGGSGPLRFLALPRRHGQRRAGSTGRVRTRSARSADSAAGLSGPQLAGQPLVDGKGPANHPFGAEPLAHPCQARPAPIRCAPGPDPSSSATIASAIAGASRGGTSRPVSPSTTTSGMPPAVVATMGRAAAIASSSDVPSPSVTELITKTSNPLSSARTSVRNPVSTTCFVEVELLESGARARPQLALADDDEPRVRAARARTIGRRVDQVTAAPCGARARRCSRRPARGAGNQNSSRTFSRLDGQHAVDVHALVDGARSRSAAMPSSTSIARIASEARNETVDLAVLPPRERVGLQMESRRGGRPRAAGRGEGERRWTGAVAATATACGSCACTTSGASSRSTRDSATPPEVHLAGGRQRQHLAAVVGAPPQFAVRVRDQHDAVPERAKAAASSAAPGSGPPPGLRRVDLHREHYALAARSAARLPRASRTSA